MNVVEFRVKPLVTTRPPPDTVKGRADVRLRIAVAPWLNWTEALARLIVTSSCDPGRTPPLQLAGLCQELSPPAPVQFTVAENPPSAAPSNNPTASTQPPNARKAKVRPGHSPLPVPAS